MIYTSSNWQPTRVIRHVESVETSTGCTRVVTDAGEAYCKPLGNRQGPCVLASEWVCLRLARWFGLQTFDGAIIDLNEHVTFPLPDHKGHKYHAAAGPCFITRLTPGDKWDGTTDRLRSLTNLGDVTKLIVFDTWVLNRDRHYPDHAVRKPNVDNVYLANALEAQKSVLIAMDHTHCFGLKGGDEITEKLCAKGAVDNLVYGLFPAFGPIIDWDALENACKWLEGVAAEVVDPMLTEVPVQWAVQRAQRAAWSRMIVSRAKGLASEFPQRLRAAVAGA